MKTAEEIMNLPPNIALLIIVTIGIFLLWLFKSRKTIKEMWDGFYNRRKKNEEYKEMLVHADNKVNEHDEALTSINETVETLQGKINEYDEENHKHWNVSVKYRDHYTEQQEQTMELLKQMASSIKDLTVQLNEFQKETREQFRANKEHDDNRHKAELRDKIMRAYRLHKDTKVITRLEYEAMEGLIQEYYSVNGNGEVKRVVEPAFYSWEIVDEVL